MLKADMLKEFQCKTAVFIHSSILELIKTMVQIVCE